MSLSEHPSSRKPSRKSGAVLAAATALALGATLAPAAVAAKPAPDASRCTDPISQPFAAWGDDDGYRPAPGGDFEAPLADWSLDAGSLLSVGTSPMGGSGVLAVGGGSSVTTAPICMDGSEKNSRVFARTGDPDVQLGQGGNRARGQDARILVESIAPDGETRKAGFFRAGEEWEPSKRFDVPTKWVRSDVGSFQYRFTSLSDETVLMDGLYVDPRARW